MGDRSNIVVQQYDGSRVWLYGHWMGPRALTIVAATIDQGERLDDQQYLARIIFSKMVENDIHGTTGYGIGTSMGDNEYPVIVLNPAGGTAWFEEPVWGSNTSKRITEPLKMEAFSRALTEDYETSIKRVMKAFAKV